MDKERRSLKVSQEAFNNNLDNLLKFLPNYYVAFINASLVFFHKDLESLTNAVYRNFQESTIFIEKVEPFIELAVPVFEQV